MVAVNSFDTWRAEQAANQFRLGYEAVGDAVEAAILKASLETAERDARCRAFMAAERAAYADLNAVAAEREADRASMEAAQLAVQEELDRLREERARADMRRAASALRQERRVRSRLAQESQKASLAGQAPRYDDEAG